MSICGIYCIFNKVNHKRYIGQSVDIEKRWRQHKYLLSNKNFQIENQHLVSAWHKYGKDNFEFFIVEKCNVKELDALEKFWIDYYNSNNSNKGYNKTLGGGQYTNVCKNDKERKGHTLSEQDVLKIVECFNKKESNTEIAKKFNVSKPIIASIRNRKSWTYLTDGLDIQYSHFYDMHKFTNGIAKSVDMYSLDGNLIKTFNSVSQAAKELNITITSISDVCNGKNVSSNGYVFRFHNYPFDLYRTEKKRDPKSIPIDQYDLNWNLIATYPSIKLASCETNIKADMIWRVIYDKRKSTGGYYWRKHEENAFAKIV